MENIDNKIAVLITEKQIHDRILELAKMISNDYLDKKIYMRCILNVFCAASTVK